MVADVRQRLLLQSIRSAEHCRLARRATISKRLAHMLVHQLRRMRRDVMRAARRRERRYGRCSSCTPFGALHRRFAGKHHHWNAWRRDATVEQLRHDLREARTAGDGGNSHLPGRQVIADSPPLRERAMLVPRGSTVLMPSRFFIAVAQCMPCHRPSGSDCCSSASGRDFSACLSFIDGHVLHWFPLPPDVRQNIRECAARHRHNCMAWRPLLHSRKPRSRALFHKGSRISWD